MIKKSISAFAVVVVVLLGTACAPENKGITGIVQRAESDGATVTLYLSNAANSDFVRIDAKILLEPVEATRASSNGQLVYYLLGLGKNYVGRKIHVDGIVMKDATSGASYVTVGDRSQLSIVN